MRQSIAYVLLMYFLGKFVVPYFRKEYMLFEWVCQEKILTKFGFFGIIFCDRKIRFEGKELRMQNQGIYVSVTETIFHVSDIHAGCSVAARDVRCLPVIPAVNKPICPPLPLYTN